MSGELTAAVEALEQALRAETQALKARDLLGAAAMQPEKTRAVEAFVRLRGLAPDRSMALRIDRLRQAVALNREMLEAAMALQARVLGVIARAASRPAAMPGYAVPRRPQAAPVSLSVKA
ncbi:hypothetical protein [Falsiroseomonas selenitidurans]|uniref:Flagellar protein FlgN n=1 Tax=Falsiroseomonas selenitidurans TaxID=2716335 RepID=A0ABX1E3E1_9PROT|nr:hypothetical protein [Falsiroseomonas selenitidurans]NKC31697.1 hypothetical protein [Falsiroseomonas selenitidurans]